MNENPGETPNPLNPNPSGDLGGENINQESALDANPAEPTQMIEETFRTGSTAPEEVNSTTSPVGATTTVDEVAPIETIDTASPTPVDPTTITPTEIVEPAKKKKTGLIIGIICVVAVLLIGGIVAAVLMMSTKKTDPVAEAMVKLMSGDASPNVAIDGTIDFLPGGNDSPISKVGITLDSKIIVGSNINETNAAVTLGVKDGQNITMGFNEIYANDGNLYFKIDGLTAALEDANLLQLLSNNSMPDVADCESVDGCISPMPTNCVEDENGVTNCTEGLPADTALEVEQIVEETTDTAMPINNYQAGFIDVISTLDGEWMKVSTDSMGLLTDGVPGNSNLNCMIDMISDINKSSKSAAELYNKYPFVTSSTKNLAVTSKANPVYMVNLDSANFAEFINAMNNSILSGGVYTCLGLGGNVTMTEDDIDKIVTNLPEIYVEVDDSYDFTRLYIKSETEDGGETVVDLGFSYPSNISVTEPVEYKNFSEVIQEAMSSVFVIPEVEASDQTIVTE